jgi:hypothetical protein
MAQDPRALLQKVSAFFLCDFDVVDLPFSRQIKQLKGQAEVLVYLAEEQKSMRTQQIFIHKPRTPSEYKSKVHTSAPQPTSNTSVLFSSNLTAFGLF